MVLEVQASGSTALSVVVTHSCHLGLGGAHLMGIIIRGPFTSVLGIIITPEIPPSGPGVVRVHQVQVDLQAPAIQLIRVQLGRRLQHHLRATLRRPRETLGQDGLIQECRNSGSAGIFQEFIQLFVY